MAASCPVSAPTLLDLVQAVDEIAGCQEETLAVLEGLLRSRRVRWLRPHPPREPASDPAPRATSTNDLHAGLAPARPRVAGIAKPSA